MNLQSDLRSGRDDSGLSRKKVLILVMAALGAVAATIIFVDVLGNMAEAGRRSNFFAREALREAQEHINAGEYFQGAMARAEANMMAVDHTWRLALIRPAMRHVIRPMADQRDYVTAINLCNSLATFERYNSPEGTGAYYQCRVIDEDRFNYEACMEDCAPIYCQQVYGLTCP